MNCIALILFEGWISLFNVYVWVCAQLARSGIDRVIKGQSYAVWLQIKMVGVSVYVVKGQSYAVWLQIKMVGVSVYVVTWGGEILS